MKKSISVFLIFISLGAWASKIARIHKVEGMGFIQKSNGMTLPLSEETVVESEDLVFIGEDSHVKVVDFFDREFILSEGSEALWREGMMELRKGDVWLTSDRDESYVVSTANAHILFNRVDTILRYSYQNARTEVSVSQGQAFLKNIEVADITVNIASGQFSFVQKEYNEGIPRTPTLLGGESYLKLTELFNQRPSKKIQIQNSPESIAQLFGQQAVDPSQEKGKLIILKSPVKSKARVSRSIASIVEVPKKSKNLRSHKTHTAKVRVFGVQNKKPKRKPASIIKKQKIKTNSFERSLEVQFNAQKRHSSERLELIDELKSVGEDFQKEY